MRSARILLTILLLAALPAFAQPIGELTGKPLGEPCDTPPLFCDGEANGTMIL